MLLWSKQIYEDICPKILSHDIKDKRKCLSENVYKMLVSKL